MALAGFVYAPVGSATFYHTDAVHPGWAARVTSVGTIGAHIFYRLPGVWGGALAYRQRYGGVEPGRSEEHTSELQSLMRISYAVFCLKKKKQIKKLYMNSHQSHH